MITPDYGYVVLAASGAWLINMWQSFQIGGKRKELGIKVLVMSYSCSIE
jgi:hypothetical protein